MVSWRTGILLLVIILALAVILPSLRVYFQQQQELSDLRAEVEQAREEVDTLEAEVARWDDPSFLVAQARERLAYVFPGETPYRVVDPEFVTTHAEGSPAAERATEAVGDGIWYEVLWDSVLVAGNGEPEISDEPTTFAGQEEAEGTLTDVDFGG